MDTSSAAAVTNRGKPDPFASSGDSPPRVTHLPGASDRLRGVPGFPRRPGRPPKHPRPVSPEPTRHVLSHVSPRRDSQVFDTADVTQGRQQDGVTSGPRAGSESRLVSVKIAADYLGVSPWTVRDLIAAGALPRVSLPGVRRVLVAIADIDQLVARSRGSVAVTP